MSAGSIVIDLLMKTGAFETDTARAEAIAKKRAQAIDQAFSDMGTRIAVGASTAGAALIAMVGSTANTAKEISNLAVLSGANATEFQRFAAAAKSVGVQQDQLGDIFKDFREKIGEFVSTGGGEMKDFFEQIAPKVGITADAFRNLSGPQALQLYFDSLQKAGLSTEQMSFYLESAANDATKLIPLLRDNGKELKSLGDEAERMGIIMDEKAIASAKEFSKNLETMQAFLNSVKIVISNEVIPVINSLSQEFLLGIKHAGGFGNALRLFGTINPFRDTEGNIKAISSEIESLTAARERYVRSGSDTSSIDTALAAERKRLEYLKEVQRLQSISALPQGPVGSPDALTRGLIPSGGGEAEAQAEAYKKLMEKYATPAEKLAEAIKKAKKELGSLYTPEIEKRLSENIFGKKSSAEKVTEAQRLLETMQRQLQTALNLTELEKLQADIQSKKIAGLTPAIQNQLVGLAKQIDMAKELGDFDRATSEYLKEREAFEKSIVALRKELMTDEERNADALKAQLELIGQIKEAADRGDLTRRAIGKATAEAPDFAGLAPEVGGPFGELAKIDEAEEKLNEWYDKQLEMLARFREERADLTAEFDEEEVQLKQQHQAKLMQIESARSIAQLSAAQSLFGNLADLTKNFAGEQSGIYKTMFALQKAAAIAQSIMAIQQGIAMAAANPWPVNLAAMASVAAATAGLISNISGVTLNARATGGPVSQNQPYLVGERGPEMFVPNTNGAIVPNNKLGGGNVTVNLIEDKSRAGQTQERNSNGAREIDVFVADIMGDGPRAKAMTRAFGLQRRGY